MSDPTTYERLIDGLKAERVGLRELAAWRLTQVDPDGAPVQRRRRSAAGARDMQWKQRIDEGKCRWRPAQRRRAACRPFATPRKDKADPKRPP